MFLESMHKHFPHSFTDRQFVKSEKQGWSIVSNTEVVKVTVIHSLLCQPQVTIM